MTTLQMNETRWAIARDLALDLHKHKADVNEFGKVIAFMRQYYKTDNSKKLMMSLLQRLANSDDAPIRSGRTKDYYRDIQASCQKHLKDINHADELMLILGWCRRLMYYYEEKSKHAAEEQRPSQEQQRTPEPPPTQTPQQPKEPEEPKIVVGNKINAIILKKEGFNITVQMQTDNNEEIVFVNAAYYQPVGAKVKMKVLAVNEKGHVTKVTPG